MKFCSSSLIAVAACALLACGRETPQTPPAGTAGQPSPEEAANARRQIVAWLECEECETGELEAVVKLGQTAVPTLAATLREGPSPAAREKLRLHLVDTYAKLKGQTRPESKIDTSEEGYVTMYMDNYDALYRVRSAQALAAIGGADAQRALEAAKGYNLREDAREIVNQSLQKIRRQ
jgi:hypothetical protein